MKEHMLLLLFLEMGSVGSKRILELIIKELH